MANKKIIVSDGNGKFKELPSSFSVDDGILTASYIIAATASFSSSFSGAVMQISGGQLSPLPLTSSVTDDLNLQGNLSGTIYQYRSDLGGIGPHRVGDALFYGDINGSLTASNPIKVKSVEHVTGGILDTKYGGTGTGSFNVGSLVTLSGSYDATSNATIMVNSAGNWSIQNKSLIDFAPLTSSVIYLFTGSVGTSNASSYTTSWSPPTGTRFVRVICQGGGGGGASGRPNNTQASSSGGGGGGGGGYADVTFNSLNLTYPINIVAGYGGIGGAASYTAGSTGGSSSFGIYAYSSGGLSGTLDNAGNVGGSGGGGYLYSGGAGGKGTNATAGVAGTSISSLLGAPGGGGGGGYITSTSVVGYAGGSLSDLSGGTAGAAALDTTRNGGNGNDGYYFNFNKYYLNSTSSITTGNFPKLRCTGGGGGAGIGSGSLVAGGNGGSATFGAGGGGGGGKNTTSPSTGLSSGNGGNGGVGYVLVICT